MPLLKLKKKNKQVVTGPGGGINDLCAIMRDELHRLVGEHKLAVMREELYKLADEHKKVTMPPVAKLQAVKKGASKKLTRCKAASRLMKEIDRITYCLQAMSWDLDD